MFWEERCKWSSCNCALEELVFTCNSTSTPGSLLVHVLLSNVPAAATCCTRWNLIK